MRLPEAGIIANQLLTKNLVLKGYYQCCHTQGLWRNKWRPIMFSLVVDDFGVEFVGKEHADHLYASIKEYYGLVEDWAGELYCGITLKWDNINRNTAVGLSMPGYVAAALASQIPAPDSTRTEPIYGAKQQLTPPANTSAALPPDGVKRILQITGTFLYYNARAVDPTMHVALDTIASQQSKAIEATAEKIIYLPDYATTHPDAIIRFRASDMILKQHSDT